MNPRRFLAFLAFWLVLTFTVAWNPAVDEARFPDVTPAPVLVTPQPGHVDAHYQSDELVNYRN
jgi:hypothetical protein